MAEPDRVTTTPPLAAARPRHAPTVVRRLVLVCVGAVVVAAILYVATVGTRTGQLVSELILGGRPASPESILAAERVLSVLSQSTLALGTIILLVIALAQRRPRLALVAVVTVVGANLSTQLLKNLLLERSDLLGGQFYVLPNSFPSGHATAAASIAVALLLVLPPLLRAPTVIISAIIVAVVAVSTLAAGWHRMADAMGGVFVAVAWAAGLAALLGWRRGVEVVGRRTAAFGRLSALLPVLLGVGALILGVVGYLLIAADPLDVLPYLAERGGSTALFWVGILITIGTCMVALGTLGFALRDARLDPRPRPASSEAQTSDHTDQARISGDELKDRPVDGETT
jgi:membrane-associated phospholipid phosphatase